MKPEAKAADQMLREAAFKLTVAIIEGKRNKARKEAEIIIILLNHLDRRSQQ